MTSPVTPSGRALLFELSWANALDGKFILALPSATVIECNPAAARLFGIPRHELIGRALSSLHPPAERDRILKELERLTPHGARYDGFHALRPDGVSVPLKISTSGVIDLPDGATVLICEFRDVTDLEEQEHRLITKRWALSAYAGAARALSLRHSRDSLLTAICQAITGEATYVFAWVGIAEEGPDKPIRVAGQAGEASGILEGLELSWDQNHIGGRGPTPVAIRTGQVQIVDETRDLTVYSPWTKRFGQFGIHSSISIPFQIDGAAGGALVVCSASPKAFGPVDLDVFTHLAQQITHGLRSIDQEQSLLVEREHAAVADRQLAEALSNMVRPIILAMEMRDPYTAGHQSRVARIAVAMGLEMGWGADQLHGLRVAAEVHDVGKISVPAEILSKPGRLTAAERAIIAEHPETGYTILKDVPFPWPVADIVRQHHEKLDGSGYPLGLTGDQILPEAKVLAVADMLEAMSSHRPYRPAWDLKTVLAQLLSEAGTRLDAEAVQTCAALFGSGVLSDILSSRSDNQSIPLLNNSNVR